MILADRFNTSPAALASDIGELAFNIRCMNSMNDWEKYKQDCQAARAVTDMCNLGKVIGSNNE